MREKGRRGGGRGEGEKTRRREGKKGRRGGEVKIDGRGVGMGERERGTEEEGEGGRKEGWKGGGRDEEYVRPISLQFCSLPGVVGATTNATLQEGRCFN